MAEQNSASPDSSYRRLHAARRVFGAFTGGDGQLTSLTATQSILLICLVAAAAAFHLASIKGGHGWDDDFALYIAHARNLAEGRPYSHTGYIFNPADALYSPPNYPPGLPLLLAPVYALRGLDLIALKVVPVAALIAALPFIALLVNQWGGFVSAMAVTALLGFHPRLYEFKNLIVSDLPFLLFFYVAVWFTARRTQHDGDRLHQSLNWVATGIITAVLWWAAYAMRSIGLVLPISLAAYELLIKRRFTRATFVALGVFLALALVQGWLLQDPGSYLANFRLHPEVVKQNFIANKGFIFDFVTLGLRGGWSLAVYRLVNLLALVGFVVSWRRGNRHPGVILLVYLAVLLVWPALEGGRFLIPVLPLYFFYAVTGFGALQRAVPRFRAVLGTAAVAAVTIAYVGGYKPPPPPVANAGIHTPAAQSLFEFVKRTTPPNAVLVFKKPRALALFTGRKAAVYTTDTLVPPWEFVDRIGARYFVTILQSGHDSVYLSRLSRSRQGAVVRVFANEDFSVYRLAPP